MIVQDLCTAALSRLGIPGLGQTVRAEDLAVAFDRLNQWIDALQTERLTIFQNTRTTFTISQKQDYTIGTGGDCNVARPTFVQAVTFQNTALTPALEMPLAALTDDGWAALGLKTLTSPYPRFYYYNATYPLATVSLYPIPTAAQLQGVIYVPTAVAQFAALSTTISLPPGYVRMLRDGLAVELAPEFGRPLDPGLVQSAREAKASVKRLNASLADMSVDPALTSKGRVYSILSDGY